MNSTSRIWDIPPPPGTEEIQLETTSPPPISPIAETVEPQVKVETVEKEKSEEKEESAPRAIDRINPYLKNPEYVEYEKRKLERRHRSRSRSRSRRRRYSRSRSRDRYRRRRKRYSSSRSKSRSPSYHRRHKYRRRRLSSNRYSKSRSRSRSRHTSGRTKSRREKATPHRKSKSKSPHDDEKRTNDVDISEVDMKIEEEEDDDEPSKDNVFRNDGTFLEMFKKMQEQQQQQKIKEEPVEGEVKKPLPIFGKRRGGKVLKTGLVQKVRQRNEEEGSSQDAWSVYMKEVRRYKEACCDDDSKTRPLVK